MSSLCQAHIFLGVPLRETITAASSNKTDQKDEKEDGRHLQRPLFLCPWFSMEGKTKVVTFVFLSCLKPKWKQTDCVLLEDRVFTCFFFFFLRLRLDLPNYWKMSSLRVKKKQTLSEPQWFREVGFKNEWCWVRVHCGSVFRLEKQPHRLIEIWRILKWSYLSCHFWPALVHTKIFWPFSLVILVIFVL